MSLSTITGDRLEQKLRVEPRFTPQLLAATSVHLREHHFSGQGGNPLPRARHYVTTVYFDTSSRALYRAVAADESNLKIRAREYYDLHPELLENATHARDIVRYNPVLFVELKSKEQGRTRKRRIGIPKREVTRFFEHGEVSAAMRDLQRAELAAGGDDVIAELLEIRERLAEPLAPSCIVSYRRTAFQNEDATLRVTFDQKLACFAPTADLLSRTAALTRESLGTPAHEERLHVLEIKARGEIPAWLETAIAAVPCDRSAFSKFETASRAVHGKLA